MDLKGFDHLGVAWSWPEFEEPSGKILRLAHAWASEGQTRCGEPWPHRVDPSGVALKYRPASAPTHARIAEIRDAEDRTVYLCMECLARREALRPNKFLEELNFVETDEPLRYDPKATLPGS